MINNKSGFSLIEVMITLAIMGTASVAFMKFQQNQIKSQKTIINMASVKLYEEQIRGYLSKPGICTQNFFGLNLDNEKEIKGIKRGDDKFKFKLGDKVPDSNFKLIALRFTRKYVDYPGDREEYLEFRAEVRLEISLERYNNNSYGGKILRKGFELDLIIDRGETIVECGPLGSFGINRELKRKTILDDQASKTKVKFSKELDQTLNDAKKKYSDFKPGNFDNIFDQSMNKALKNTGKTISKEELKETIENNPQLKDMFNTIKEMQEMNKRLLKIQERQ